MADLNESNDDGEPAAMERRLTPLDHRLTVKDRLSLILSMLAFAVSLVSLYLSNFYVSDSALARIAEVSVSYDDSKGAEEDRVTTRFTLANSGNRPIVVLKAFVDVRGSPDDQSALASDPTPDAEVFPLLIPAHDIRLISLDVPMSLMRNNMGTGEAFSQLGEEDKSEPWRRFLISFSFVSLASDGVVHHASAGDQVAVELMEEDDKRWQLGAADPKADRQYQYPAVDLLQ